jgi:hypothetical protein
MSVPPVVPRRRGAQLECLVDFIESYFQRLETLGTPCCTTVLLASEGQRPDARRIGSSLTETRLRELPHPNLSAQSEWVPCRIAFAPPAEGRKRGVRGKRAVSPRLEHHERRLLPAVVKPMLPAGQYDGAVKPSLTLFWLILARHQQAP